MADLSSKQITHYDIPTVLRGEHKQPCACVECRAADEIDRQRAEIEKLTKALRIAELKAAGTLANNLCPDHRDKQTGRPCLACEIERLTWKLTIKTEACEFHRNRANQEAAERDRLAAENSELRRKLNERS